jgi:hypothetical protein
MSPSISLLVYREITYGICRYHYVFCSLQHSANISQLYKLYRVEREYDSTWWVQKEKTKNALFWDVAPCKSCVNWRFGGTYRLHFRVEKPRGRIQSEQVAKCRRFLPPKCRFTQDLHGATSQKMAFILVNAVKTPIPLSGTSKGGSKVSDSHDSTKVVRLKILSWVPRGPESRMTVLANTSSHLPETKTEEGSASGTREDWLQGTCK